MNTAIKREKQVTESIELNKYKTKNEIKKLHEFFNKI